MTQNNKLKPAIKSLDKKILHEIHADVEPEGERKPLVIGIDGNEANVKNRVGSNMVAYRLLLEFAKLEKNKKNGIDHKWIIYLKDKPLDDFPKESENWQYQVIRMRKMWTQVRLPWELYFGKNKLDVFFSPGHYAPRWCPLPLVVTILDTAYLDFPEYFRKQDLAQLKVWTKRSVKMADYVIAISQHTKNDIVKNYEKFDKHVVVAYMGIDHEHFFFPQTDKEINRVKKKYNISGDYILYLGTLQPRKNLVRLIEGFKMATDQRKGMQSNDESLSFEGLALVIAGKKGWMYDQIFEKVRELNLEKNVIFTDFVPDEDVPALMAGARCMALLALYEGFGIPVIEGMSVGTPAVVSNVSSLPEVLGNAGFKCDPNSVKDIAKKLGEMLDLPNEEYYKLADKGIQHASLFTWRKTAGTVLKILEHAGGLPT